jgi:hypothetical protein
MDGSDEKKLVSYPIPLNDVRTLRISKAVMVKLIGTFMVNGHHDLQYSHYTHFDM